MSTTTTAAGGSRNKSGWVRYVGSVQLAGFGCDKVSVSVKSGIIMMLLGIFIIIVSTIIVVVTCVRKKS